MPAFRYVAIDPAGKMARGVMDAANEAAVVQRLRRDGHLPVRTELDTGGSFFGRINIEITRSGLGAQALANFTRELSIMLAAGQDLDRALRFLVETSASRRMAAVVEQLRSAVRDGSSLAVAMGNQGASFPRLYVGMVRAGRGGRHAGGRRSTGLPWCWSGSAACPPRSARQWSIRRCSGHRDDRLGVVPADLGAAPNSCRCLRRTAPSCRPRHSSWSISATSWRRTGSISSSALAVLALLIVQALRQPRIRLVFDRLLLRLPILGRLAREVLAARFSRTFGTLMLNGVPLIAALGIVREAIGNRAAVAAVDAATASAKSGSGLSGPWRRAAFSRCGLDLSAAARRGDGAAGPDGASAPPRSTRRRRGSASRGSCRCWSRRSPS